MESGQKEADSQEIRSVILIFSCFYYIFQGGHPQFASLLSTTHSLLMTRMANAVARRHNPSSANLSLSAEKTSDEMASFNETLRTLRRSGQVEKWIDDCRHQLMPQLTRIGSQFVLGYKTTPRSPCAASADTFFENNYGFKEKEFLKPKFAPQIQSFRGFKSKRYNNEGANLPFSKDRVKPDGTSNNALGSLFDSDSGNSSSSDKGNLKVSDLLSQSGISVQDIIRNAELSKEDRGRISAAVYGYAVGLGNKK